MHEDFASASWNSGLNFYDVWDVALGLPDSYKLGLICLTALLYYAIRSYITAERLRRPGSRRGGVHRHGRDAVIGRAADQLRADRDVNQHALVRVEHPVDLDRLE